MTATSGIQMIQEVHHSQLPRQPESEDQHDKSAEAGLISRRISKSPPPTREDCGWR
jgi:hypothetical protein